MRATDSLPGLAVFPPPSPVLQIPRGVMKSIILLPGTLRADTSPKNTQK